MKITLHVAHLEYHHGNQAMLHAFTKEGLDAQVMEFVREDLAVFPRYHEDMTDDDALELFHSVSESSFYTDSIEIGVDLGEITIVLDGGLVNCVITDGPLVGLSFNTLDYDTEGADEDELSGVLQSDGRILKAVVGGDVISKSAISFVPQED